MKPLSDSEQANICLACFLLRVFWNKEMLYRHCFSNFASEYAINRVQAKQDGLKLNGTYHLLVYADDVNVFCGSVHTLENNKDALVVASMETGLEVNADKTKSVVMS
jgi:hypothetical protein